MNTDQLIMFCKDWNAGVSVKEMAIKYAIKPVTVRSRVASLRKKGVKVEKRSAAKVEIDVKTINRSL